MRGVSAAQMFQGSLVNVLAAGCGLAACTAAAWSQASAPSADYADSRVCAGCHAGIAAAYRKTGMARAFYPVSAASGVEDASKGLPFYHSGSGAFYTMERRGDEYFQRRWEKGADGKDEYQAEWKVDYAMGSGNHVRTYLHGNPNGTLDELPLAWYAEKGGYWAMNPGYDTDGYIAPRKIAYECMFCHNGYPRIPAGNERANSVPVYEGALPEGIDCQRCHGPGERHVQLARTAGASEAAMRGAIFNPAHLAGEKQMEVCMQCHLQTTSRRLPAAIRRFDRGPFDYRAGEPLSGFLLYFDRTPGGEERVEIVSSVTRLRESKCYLESKGAMTCLTCHDPHDIPRGEAAPKHYNGVCGQCHREAFQALVKAGRHTGGSDCISCHMPKRRTDDVVHAVITDHRIQRLKPARDLLADLPEEHETEATAYKGPVVPYYPKPLPEGGANAFYLAVAQVQHGSNLDAGIRQLADLLSKLQPAETYAARFYFELGEALRKKGDTQAAHWAYTQARARDPRDAWTLRMLDDPLGAITASPDDARSWYALGELEGSEKAFEKAVELDPDLIEGWNNLGSLLAARGNASDAEAAFRQVLAVQPDSAAAQENLGTLLAAQGRIEEAAPHFARSLKRKPENGAVRVGYAFTLARMRQTVEAMRQVDLALKGDPGLVEGHLLRGNLLQNARRIDDAIGEYREALRRDPGFARAQADLGTALAQKGEITEAIEMLRRAAAGGDSAARERALAALRALGQ